MVFRLMLRSEDLGIVCKVRLVIWSEEFRDGGS